MTESSYALSLRKGDATLHIRGADYDEFYGNAAVALGEQVDAVLESFRGSYHGAPTEEQAKQNLRNEGMLPPDQPPPPPPPPSTPPPPPSSPPRRDEDDAWKANPPECKHGPRQPRTGTNRNGNPYRAFFCPLPKERRAEQCKPEFVD